VYAQGDTMFNESFATAVERLGSQRWLTMQASDQARSAYAVLDGRRRQFRALTQATRRELSAIYEQKTATAQSERAQIAMKNVAIERFRESYALLKTSWGGFAGYDPWVARANNASFAAQAAYDELVPGFEALFEREDRNWLRFYDAVKRLARLPKTERHQALQDPLNITEKTETTHG
jgi:predicted aminopeptidase